MNTEVNSTTPSLMDKLFGHVFRNVSQPATTGSYPLTPTTSWSHQNVTGQPEEYDSYTGLPVTLITRIAVVVCVVIGLFVASLASYTIHRKCVKDGWKQQQHKSSLFL